MEKFKYSQILIFQTGNKEECKKTVRNIIKISIKIGMLQRGEKFSDPEKDELVQIQRKLRMVAMTLVSFFQVQINPGYLSS